MALITLHNVTLGFGNAPVLENISLSIEPGARACVTGRNGEGKSTLLKVLAGVLEPDSGEVLRQNGLRVAYLPQDVPEDRPGSVRENLLQAITDPSREYVADALCTRLELPAETPFNALSGGLRRRVLLGCALAKEPHLLLLDEPTNHLDIPSIRWLEKFLATAPFACLFITHDRAFLRAVARTVFDLDRGLLSGWDCDYPTFLRRKAELLADEAVYWERKSKKLSEEEAWLRRGVKARTCRNEGRVAALMKLREEFAQRRSQVGKASLSLSAEGGRTGDLVYRCEGVTFGYDPARPILRDVSLRLLRGERIGILGANGAGKTTLLRLLLGQLTSQAGEQRIGANVQAAFFDQLRGALDPEATVAENVAEGKEFVTIGGVRKHLYGYLGDFLFTPERARTPVKALSGGERARVLLARLFLNPGNVLVMDEPTNDLDIETLELLEEQLANYAGTLLLVSHDRDFIDRVVTSVLVVEDGRVTAYPGGYSDYETARERQAAQTAQATPAPEKTEAPEPTAQSRRTNRPERLSYKEQRLLQSLPERIEALEGEVAELNAALLQPGADYAALSETLAKRQAELDEAFEQYCELEEKAQRLS
ncbi:MAG: ATP-binding cassette domain-containing protein [Candidatus Spyradenecus sp.]